MCFYVDFKIKKRIYCKINALQNQIFLLNIKKMRIFNILFNFQKLDICFYITFRYLKFFALLMMKVLNKKTL